MSAHHVVAVDAVRGVLHAVVDFPPEHRQVLGKPAGGGTQSMSVRGEAFITAEACRGTRLVLLSNLKLDSKTRRHQSTRKGPSVYLLHWMLLIKN